MNSSRSYALWYADNNHCNFHDDLYVDNALRTHVIHVHAIDIEAGV